LKYSSSQNLKPYLESGPILLFQACIEGHPLKNLVISLVKAEGRSSFRVKEGAKQKRSKTATINPRKSLQKEWQMMFISFFGNNYIILWSKELTSSIVIRAKLFQRSNPT